MTFTGRIWVTRGVYKHPRYSSISVYVPPDLNPRLDRICTNCDFRAALDGWEDAGTVETCTDDERTRQNAAVMHMLGIGPPPPILPLIQRIRDTLFGRPKLVDLSVKYPAIKIACVTCLGFSKPPLINQTYMNH